MPRRASVRRTPVRLISYAGRRPVDTVVFGSLALALKPAPVPRLRPPLMVAGEQDLRREARLIAQLVMEVLAGHRPHHHLAGRTTSTVFELLHEHAGRIPSPEPPKLRTLKIFQPTPEAAEITVVAAYGPQIQAVALRLHHRGRWRCAAIETTAPPP